MFLSRLTHRWDCKECWNQVAKHEDPQKDTEPAKKLKSNLTHASTWKALPEASSNKPIKQDMEASIIAFKRPLLTERVE